MLHLRSRQTAIIWSLLLVGVVSSAAIYPSLTLAQEQGLETEEPEQETAQGPEPTPAPFFVSDQLEITLRRGPGTQFGIKRMLKSGTPVQIIEDNGAGYARVTTNEGATGWVLTRFLQTEPVARQLLIQNEREIETLRQEITGLQEQFGGMQQLQDNLSRVMTENRELSQELELVKTTAADALAISEEYETLKQRLEESGVQQEKLMEMNRRLEEDTQQRWFLIGGGVAFAGILIGLILPKVRWRRRRVSMGGGVNIDL